LKGESAKAPSIGLGVSLSTLNQHSFTRNYREANPRAKEK